MGIIEAIPWFLIDAIRSSAAIRLPAGGGRSSVTRRRPPANRYRGAAISANLEGRQSGRPDRLRTGQAALALKVRTEKSTERTPFRGQIVRRNPVHEAKLHWGKLPRRMRYVIWAKMCRHRPKMFDLIIFSREEETAFRNDS